MNHRKSLHLAFSFCQLASFLIAVFYSAFVITLTYSLLNTAAFQNVIVNDAFYSGYGVGNIKICSTCSGTDVLHLNDLNPSMKFWLLVRGSIFFILTFLIIRVVKRIIQSIKSLSTFYEGNIRNFKILGIYGLVISFFSAFNFLIQGEISNFHFSVPFAPIAFSLACLVLADIFREGQILTEDKNSII